MIKLENLMKNKVTRKSTAFSIILFFVFSMIIPLISVQKVQAVSIIDEGFEEGDLGVFSTLEPSNHVVSTVDPYQGTYHLNTTAPGWSAGTRIYKSITGVTELYARAFVKMNTSIVTGVGVYPLGVAGDSYQYLLSSIGFMNVSGTNRYAIQYRNGSTLQEATNDTATADAYTDYNEIQLHTVIDASAGYVEMYVDNVKVLEVTGLNNSAYGNIDYVWSGAASLTHNGYNAAKTTIFIDTIQASDEYLGGVDSTPPTLGAISMNSTAAEATANLTCTATDINGVDFVWFAHNATGTMTNQTAIDANEASPFTAKFTLTNPTPSKLMVQCFANDTSGNVGSSSVTYFNIVTYTPPAHYLHVEGNKLLNSSDIAISLEGVNVNTMIDMPSGFWMNEDGEYVYGWNTTNVDRTLRAIADWHCTAIRLTFTVQFWVDNEDGFRDNVKYILNWCGNHSITVSFCAYRGNDTEPLPDGVLPWASGNEYLTSEQDFIDLWVDIATELKDYPAVMFEFWNEPNGDATEESDYMDVAQQTVTAIRSIPAYNPIVIQWGYGIGYDYGTGGGTRGDMTWVADYPITDMGNNLIMSTHIYGTNFYNSTNDFARVTDYTLLKTAFTACDVYSVADVYPLWFGEHGFNSWQNVTLETEYFTNVLTLLNETDVTDGFVGFAAWAWRMLPDQFPLWAWSGGTFDPNNAGDIIISFMADNPMVEDSYSASLDVSSPTDDATYTGTVPVDLDDYSTNGTNPVRTWTVTLSNGTVIANTTYTEPTSFTVTGNMTGVFTAYLETDEGANDTETVWFTVVNIEGGSLPDVTVTVNQPTASSYETGSILVSFSASGGTINTKWFNVKNGSSWIYATNQTYTAPQFITGYANGTYTFYAFANNTYAVEGYATVSFTVAIPSEAPTVTNPVLTIVSPFNRTYITGSFKVELSWIGTADAVWYNIKNGSTWVYTYNLTYTAATNLNDFVNGSYTFYAFAANSLGGYDEATVMFSVGIIPNPVLPQVNVDAYWLFLWEGDFLGFIQSYLVTTFLNLETAVVLIVMLFMVPLYLRTKSLLLLSILWLLLGGLFVAVLPAASGLALLFVALGVGGLLWRLFRPTGYG